jgi:hypothetical protein
LGVALARERGVFGVVATFSGVLPALALLGRGLP